MIRNFRNSINFSNYPNSKNFGTVSFASKFLSESQHLECYLVANPLYQNDITSFNEKTNQSIEIINRIIDQDDLILRNPSHFRSEKIVYFLLLWEYLAKKENISIINKSRADYLINVLNSISIDNIGNFLYDQLFSISNPQIFKKIKSKIQGIYLAQEQDKNEIERIISNLAFKNNIPIEINSRIKSTYSIWEKLNTKNLLIDQLNDIIGIRIITENEVCCYKILNHIIMNFEVMHDTLKDYISFPKDNGYQSIHASILFNQKPIEIQIRSHQMHMACEYGKACHVTYKSNHSRNNKLNNI